MPRLLLLPAPAVGEIDFLQQRCKVKITATQSSLAALLPNKGEGPICTAVGILSCCSVVVNANVAADAN
jgi:hypothetical protein